MTNLRKRTIEQIRAELPAVAEVVPEAPDPASLVPVPGTPSYATAASVRVYLERCTALVAINQLMPSQAQAIANFAALALKLVELQNERDLIDLELRRAEQEDQHQPVRFAR